jgi:hypothetical protein
MNFHLSEMRPACQCCEKNIKILFHKYIFRNFNFFPYISPQRIHTVTLYVCLWTGFGLVNAFIDHLFTPPRTTSNYSAITNLHTLRITTAVAEPQSFIKFPSRCLVRALNIGDSSAFVLTPLLSGEYPTTDFTAPAVMVITSRHGPHTKLLSIVAFASVAVVSVYRAVAQKRSLFTASPLSNGSIRHNMDWKYLRAGCRGENLFVRERTCQENAENCFIICNLQQAAEALAWLSPLLGENDILRIVLRSLWGTRKRSLLRHYATSRKVAGSIHDEIIGFFNWSNPSGSIMALGATQPLTEISTRNLPGGKGRPECKADNLTAICERDCLENEGASTSHNPMGLHGLLQRQTYRLPCTIFTHFHGFTWLLMWDLRMRFSLCHIWIFSRQSVHRWLWSCQPYSPATIYPQNDSCY